MTEGISEGFLEEVASKIRLERRGGRRMVSWPLFTPDSERRQGRRGHL